jgi:hypothetical protein
MNTEVRTVRHVPFAEKQPAPPPKRRAWGKLALQVFVLVLLVAAAGGLVAYQMLFAALKRSEPYQLGLQQAQKDKNLIVALGEPIEDVTWFPLGKTFTTEEGLESMNVDFRVAGSKAHATIQVEAVRKEGQWILQKLVGTPDGGRPIVLDRGDASGVDVAPAFNPGAANPPPAKTPGPDAKTEAPLEIVLPGIPGM